MADINLEAIRRAEVGHEINRKEYLKYLAWAQGRPIACLAWSSAPRHLCSRDRYIGWNAEARRRNIRVIAYNYSFSHSALGSCSTSGVAPSRPC